MKFEDLNHIRVEDESKTLCGVEVEPRTLKSQPFCNECVTLQLKEFNQIVNKLTFCENTLEELHKLLDTKFTSYILERGD